MSNTIIIKRSGTANSVPTSGQLTLGELAINYNDGNLFYKDSGGTVQLLTSNQFVSVAGNITGGNILTNGYVSALGNVTGGNLNAAGLSLSSNVVSALNSTSNITTTANVSGGNLLTSGILSATSNVIGGNVTTVGLISATGNITGGNIGTAGNVAAFGVLTDNYYYANGTPLDFQQPAGSNTQIQFNNNSDFGASANLTFNSATNLLTVIGAASVSGNITSGNVNTGIVSASGNVIGANVNTGIVSASGNVDSGNVNTGIVSASGNITGANVNTAIVSASGNVIGGNLTTVGQVSATGNITGDYLLANIAYATGYTASKIYNGLSEVNIATANGNANISIAGTPNVAVFTTGGLEVTGTVSASGNITGANVNTTNLSLTGNVISPLNVTGNVTSGNLLTTGVVSAAGNVTGGNLIAGTLVSATTVSASGNVTGGNVNTNTISGVGTTILSTGDINLSATGNITIDSRWINNLADPVQDQDAATKYYVDTVAQGLHIHAAANLATTADLATYTGATVTYNNGAGGVGATLSLTGNTLTTLDGTAIPASARLLIKNEANAVYNGIYNYTSSSLLTRSADANQDADLAGGDFIFVQSGNTLADTGWVQVTDNVSIGNSNIVWDQFSGAGAYTANTAAGLFLNGTQFNAKVDNNTTAFDGGGNIVVKASANLTTPNIGAATGTSLSLTGNITGNYLNAVGISLTGNVISVLNATGNINGANINGVLGVYSGGVQVLTINDTVDGGTY